MDHKYAILNRVKGTNDYINSIRRISSNNATNSAIYKGERQLSDNMDEPDKPEGYRQYHSKLVGVTFEGRQSVIGVLVGTEPLRVRRESDNKYDPNAVAVDVQFGEDWAPIGYIAKDKNSDIAATLDAGGGVNISIASITGGGDKSYGVNVEIEYTKVEKAVGVPVGVVEEQIIEITPEKKLQDAILEYANEVGGKKTITYTSRLLDDSIDVVETNGHIAVPGFLSGSAFPKKFYAEFDSDGMLDKIVEKHYGKESDEKKEFIKNSLLAMWELNKNASTSYGTAIHAAMENFDKYHVLGDKTKKVEVLKTKTNIGPNKALSRNPFLKKIVEDFHKLFGGDYLRLNEEFVWLTAEKFAGSIDRIKVIDLKKKIIRIQDFKTDGDIHEDTYQLPESPFKGVGKKALKAGTKEKSNTVENTLLGLHWLQLSFYAYIMKKRGWTVEGLDVYWVNPEKLSKGENPWEEFSHDVIDISKGL